jgi:creatinine amidohydrolase
LPSDADARLLERLTWPEVAQAISAGLPIVTPIGSMEQHGHHMPLGTDALLPHALMRRVGRARELVLAPPVFVAGRSHPRSGGGGASFPGTTALPLELLTATLHTLAQEFLRQGFTRLAFVNGHFENATPLYEAVERAVAPLGSGAKAVIINWWELVTDADIEHVFPGKFPGWELEHAGVIETSLMMELFPELVRAGETTDGPGVRPAYDVVPTPASLTEGSGVPGLSTPASRAIGEYIAGRIVERTIGIFDAELAAAERVA